MVVTVQVWMMTGLDGSRGAKVILPLDVCLERWNVTKVNTNASSSPRFIMAMVARSFQSSPLYQHGWVQAGEGHSQLRAYC